MRLIIFAGALYFAFAAAIFLLQRRMLYYPSHHGDSNGLTPWSIEGRPAGWARSVPHPKNIWLFMHGNAGQATDRSYTLPHFAPTDSVYFLEYPGYGDRPGTPGRAAIDAAAQEAYRWLKGKFPTVPVCVAGESIGSGPAAQLARLPEPPARVVLVTPFDSLVRVARHHFPWLPAGLLLRDRWDNVAALKGYRGVVEIYGAAEDDIIPIRHAKALAASHPGALFHLIPGGHNDWPEQKEVQLRN